MLLQINKTKKFDIGCSVAYYKISIRAPMLTFKFLSINSTTKLIMFCNRKLYFKLTIMSNVFLGLFMYFIWQAVCKKTNDRQHDPSCRRGKKSQD